jgi:hypothetical protein
LQSLPHTDLSTPRPQLNAKFCESGAAEGALPANGRTWKSDRRESVAPLEVRVRGSAHYLVKLERDGFTSATMFVRAGSSAEMLMPIGDYILKYAAGDGGLWCGHEARLPFGQTTTFHRAESTFTFRDDGDQFTGYTVELYLRPDGNLRSTQIAPSQW